MYKPNVGCGLVAALVPQRGVEGCIDNLICVLCRGAPPDEKEDNAGPVFTWKNLSKWKDYRMRKCVEGRLYLNLLIF